MALYSMAKCSCLVFGTGEAIGGFGSDIDVVMIMHNMASNCVRRPNKVQSAWFATRN
ncbi:hypothetical protein M405DRAFT_856695 [Rhizopogon salebrosus TDB-379]|nr:hypothetical protein M405DRAFT_856695 [Rhizopogon salebrosus TDB-379]